MSAQAESARWAIATLALALLTACAGSFWGPSASSGSIVLDAGVPRSESHAPEVQGGAMAVPSAPRNLQAEGGDGEITLTWDPPEDEGGLPLLGYNIYRGTSSGEKELIASVPLITTHTDPLVENGVTYYYHVTAVNFDGESDPSNEASATPGDTPTVPGPPENLTATGGDGTVTLAWSAPDDNGSSPITNYHIYRSTSPGNESTYDTVGDVHSYTDSGVTNAVTYYYKVSAENDAGEGALSNEASATPEAPPIPPTPPGPPLNLEATAGDATVTLDWSPPTETGGSPITNYSIYRGMTSGQLSLLATIPDVLSYQDADVTNGVTYYYEVTAVNSAGEGPPSNEVSVTPTSGDTVPDPPTNLVAVAGDARVTLTWQAPSFEGGTPITEYRIHRGTSPGGESLLTAVEVDPPSYVDADVTNGVTYYYEVTAVNAVGEGDPSNEVSATPLATPTVPDAPQSLRAVPGDARVELTWSPPADNGGEPITNYKIYRGTSSGDRSNVTTVGNVTSHSDLGLTNGRRYYYSVTAVSEVGEGPYSVEVSAVPATVPGAPTDLRAVSGEGLVTLRWSAPESDGGAPPTNFEIYRRTTSGDPSRVATVGDVDSHVDSNVTNGVTYYYQVSAVNRVGEGPMSAEVSATPTPVVTVPGAPESFVATAGNRAVRLAWSPPSTDGGSPIRNYTVYRGLSSDNLTRFVQLGPAQATWDLTVSNDVTYFYEVAAVNDQGEGPHSSPVSAAPHASLPPPDTTNPAITIASPATGATAEPGPIEVTGTASDDVGVVRVEVSQDGLNWVAASGLSAWTATLSLEEGNRTIYARAIDAAENTATTTVDITVGPPEAPDDAEPGPIVVGPSDVPLIIAFFSFTTLIGVAWLLLGRRRGL